MREENIPTILPYVAFHQAQVVVWVFQSQEDNLACTYETPSTLTRLNPRGMHSASTKDSELP